MATTSNSLVLAQSIGRAAVAATAAKTTYADNTNAVLLMAATSNGTFIRKLTATARATVTATQLQLYVYDGTNYWYHPISPMMSAYTMTQTTANGSTTDFGFGETSASTGLNGLLYLPAGMSLYVGIGVALSAGIVFHVEYSPL